MKKYLSDLLEGFEFNSAAELIESLSPSFKYNVFALLSVYSLVVSYVNRIFGIDLLAIAALFLVMMLEVFSGIYASQIKKEPLSSRRMSRFTFKAACYLVLISVPWLFYESFHARSNELGASLFEWLHLFFVTHIVGENLISVLENIAVIQGKDKTFWINSIKKKFRL